VPNTPKTLSVATAELRAGQRSDVSNTILFWLLIAGLAWLPFWYGSNDLVAWGANAIFFPALTIIMEVMFLARGQSHPVRLNEIRLPFALFTSVILWILFQNATWTPSSLHHPIWSMAAEVLGRPVEGSISVNRDLTVLALIRLLAAGCTFWTALQLCRDPSRAGRFLTAICLIAAGYAVYALISLSLQRESLDIPDIASPGYATATFFNRNHFATYTGMGLVAACGLLTRFYSYEVGARGGPINYRISSAIEATGRQGAILICAAFLLLVGLLLSASRGAIAATAIGLLVFAILSIAGRSGNAATHRTIVFVVLCAVAAISFIFGQAALGMLSEKGVADLNRGAVYLLMLRSIFDAPLLGYGYGTFIDVFPMFRDGTVEGQGIWEYAHNTYLEAYQGLGLIFGSALIMSVVLLVLRCCNGAILRERGSTAPKVAASIAFLVGVHSLVDFSLQIQAITLTFAAVLGAGVAQAKSSRAVIND
jgi:O-antigen ligase